MRKRAYWAIAAAGVAGVAGLGWWIGMSQGMKMAAPAVAQAARKAGDIDPATGRKVLYWHDPMTPGPKFDHPGKSPFMDMQLVPVYAGEAGETGVDVSSRIQQNLGVRLAEVKRGEIASKVEAVGNVAWNDRDVVLVQARANGFLEKLHVRAAMDPVAEGQALAELYVPEWVAAQEEFLAVSRMQGPAAAGLREGAAQRMRLAGMSEAQVRQVEREAKVSPRLTIVAPIAGVVSELLAREGMTVATGTPLFRINGLATVWVNVEVPEAASARVRAGDRVAVAAAALPGERFEGRVAAALPEVNTTTRTRKVRIELPNPSRRLVPGMSATADFSPAPRMALLVPSEALIRTGERTVAMVAETDPSGAQRFHAVEVEAGVDSGGMTEIRAGLEPGMKVVASGQFLLDSEASLRAGAARLGEGGGSKP
jgi:Cu(I)/Ag(I) efflux system membrane fusion protein